MGVCYKYELEMGFTSSLALAHRAQNVCGASIGGFGVGLAPIIVPGALFLGRLIGLLHWGSLAQNHIVLDTVLFVDVVLPLVDITGDGPK